MNREAASTVELVYDETPHKRISPVLTVGSLQKERYRIPGIVISGTAQSVLLVTAASRSFLLANIDPKNLSCRFSKHIFERSTSTFLSETAQNSALEPAPISTTPAGGSLLVVPPALHAALAHGTTGHGIIVCAFAKPLAASPTYTDRALTLTVRGLSGVFLLDISALEDIDNLRFSGGISFPLTGERTRFLDSSDSIVSVEWIDVSAAERRDIILVIVGALAAISAATAIEAIRPFIER